MDLMKFTPSAGTPSINNPGSRASNRVMDMAHFEKEVEVDLREIYLIIMHFISSGPCQRTFGQLWNELLEHDLLPRRYHASFSRNGAHSGIDNDDGVSLPLSYNKLVDRYPHIEKDHLVKLMKQLLRYKAYSTDDLIGAKRLSAADAPTLLGSGSFSLLDSDQQNKTLPAYLHWPHKQADQVRGLGLREIGGGFAKHHRAPSIRAACYAIAKPSTMVQKMQNVKRLRGHRNAVYCAIFDRSGRYVITGSDDRLVKIWSMETAFCLASCRGHEGDITDLAVSSNNAVVASAANDFVIRVWRLPDGFPISVLRGHTAAVTAIAFSPRTNCPFQLLSSSDDGSCRIWDARSSLCRPRVYVPKPLDSVAGKSVGPASNGPSSVNLLPSNQILCCAYNANGTVFVTGSSDTYARVWSAFKSNADESDQPIHEMDLLSGHENDVNYVQFSDCAVASRSSMTDTLKEENFPRFKNTGLCHDNIVTCSRDGSAIIWIPRSRKSNVKSWRWTKSYHLRVPPPPLPPQPPRGGPRQRILPTPRGVNMIVWSLDNRFVLAAIMDCRICVWNAVDGSLVHSLTGHTQSSYVLDVHPFNPRIAMSAGYDGKTIVWDIWEGTPIRIYEIGRFKLVDGKFSPDGTSIVLSDDVGQIYLLNTGQGDAQKDAKYDQFFLGDYRPLIRDTAGNVLDQETQLPPYRRNLQEPICDSSMIPYPDPYQTMFQQRRLGALGVEWRPSSMKFAIGPDISFGQDYQMPPLEDLDRMIEPLPEFLDGLYWEPENEIISDDNDSEYDVAGECTSEGEQGSLHYVSSSDPDGSAKDSDVEHDQKDGIRRSRRRKHKTEVDLTTPSKRYTKKRNLAETDGSTSGTSRVKKLKSSRKVSKKKSSFAKSSRPQRVAARNALNKFSGMDETSTDGEEADDSEGDASNSETVLPESNIQSDDSERYIESFPEKCDAEDMLKPSDLSQPESDGKRKKLVLKISLRDIKKPLSSEDRGLDGKSHSDLVGPSIIVPQETRSDMSSRKQESSSTNVFNVGLFEDQQAASIAERGHTEMIEDHMEKLEGTSIGKEFGLEEVKVQTNELPTLRDAVPGGMSVGLATSSVAQRRNRIDLNEDGEQLGSSFYQDSTEERKVGPSDDNHHSLSLQSPSLANWESKHGGSAASFREDDNKGERDWSGSEKCRHCDSEQLDEVSDTYFYSQLKENPPPKVVKLKIRTGGTLKKPASPSKVKLTRAGDDLAGDRGDTMSEDSSHIKQNEELGVLDKVDGLSKSMSHEVHHREKSSEITKLDLEVVDDVLGGNTSSRPNNWSCRMGSDAGIDDRGRTGSTSKRASAGQPNAVNSNSTMKVKGALVGTSRDAGKNILPEERTPSLKLTIKSKFSGKGLGGYDGMTRRKPNLPGRKLSWLLLSSHEDGYRYIPQKGDDVVYLRQGHQEYIESIDSREKGPWRMVRGPLRAVEICRVDSLTYAQVPSGDSCCKIQLRFTDRSCCAFGKSFEFTLPELVNFPDFIVEKARYDAAISRNWTPREQCMVWWRNENGEDGDWWDGRIISSKAKSDKFPDSPWERYFILYETDNPEEHRHSPWELHDPDISWEHPHIDVEIREKLLEGFAKLELSVSKKKDYFGFGKLTEASRKPDYFNRFPVPLCPDIILARLENNYYRTLEAFKHDISVMIDIAKTHFARSSELSSKMDHLSAFFRRHLISDS